MAQHLLYINLTGSLYHQKSVQRFSIIFYCNTFSINLHDLCCDSCVKIEQLVFLNRLQNLKLLLSIWCWIKSLKLFSPIVTAFIKSFWTVGGALICDERPTILSLCSNGLCQLLIWQQCCTTTFSSFLICVLPKYLGTFFLVARLTISLKFAISPVMI